MTHGRAIRSPNALERNCSPSGGRRNQNSWLHLTPWRKLPMRSKDPWWSLTSGTIPGGGVAGDSTLMLRDALAQNLKSAAFGTIWDPMAVRLCHAAGEGARLNLRFGGKTSSTAGDPIDATVTVRRNQRDAVQSFGTSVVPLGDCSVIRFGGIDVVLNSNRSQTFCPISSVLSASTSLPGRFWW